MPCLGIGGEKRLIMKQIPLLIPFLTFFGAAGFAQSAIVPIGGDAQGNSGNVSYTVGQIAVESAASSNGSITIVEGVQQPY